MRQLLFSHARVEAIYSFENWGKRFFQIHASFKFLTLVFEKQETANQSFPAAFMLHSEGFLAMPETERETLSVRISSDFIRPANPSTWSIIELRDDSERRLVERIYRAVPQLARQLTGPGDWNLELHRELHMTDDAWRFRKRDWLLDRGCQPRGICFVAPPEEYYKLRPTEYVAGVRYIVPEGTRYRVASSKPTDAIKSRKVRVPILQVIPGFLRLDRADDENELPVVPGATYVPLYEGRMVQQFDHAAKAYVGGEGRGAKWRDLGYGEKHLVAHYFVDGESFSSKAMRTGICKVTGQTNERSALTALIPSGLPTGESLNVAFVDRHSPETDLPLIASINSFVVDFLLRQKILTNLSQFHLASAPIWRPRIDSNEFSLLARKAARLVSITPEIQLAEPALDARNRAPLRAEIDAIVAGLYDLSPAEFGYILTTFPLLDRDQPSLPDDFFIKMPLTRRVSFRERNACFVCAASSTLPWSHLRNLTTCAGWRNGFTRSTSMQAISRLAAPGMRRRGVGLP
ncbi:MAG TPA: hypothetical protein VG096_06590 [Bryobacteraceae bacterium]|nr:hypothetical protein [Bryobacteraceae bacterium]